MTIATGIAPEKYSAYSLADLLELMSWKDTDENKKEAEQAFSEFYHRVERKLKYIITKATKKFIQVYDIDEFKSKIFSDTLLKAYHGGGNFTTSPEWDTAMIERKVYAWLSVIAKNECLKILEVDHARYSDEQPTSDEFWDNIPEDDESDEVQNDSTPSPEEQLIHDAVVTLNEKEYNILFTYLENEEPNKKLRRTILDSLCETHGTTKENLRKIKQRAIEKVASYVEQQKLKTKS